MGAAVGYALAQPALVTFAIFTALALGLALPYVALTLQPAWTRLLPKPGAWMEILRQAVSVPIFATVIWLAWVLAQAYGAAVVAALLCSLLLLAIAGWFLGRWPAQRWSTITAVVIVLAAILLSVIAPSKLEAVPQAESQAGAQTQDKWEAWSPDALSRYQAQGRPVFVDFTASWCLSCQVNERVAPHSLRTMLCCSRLTGLATTRPSPTRWQPSTAAASPPTRSTRPATLIR
jgi:thiol:disulfide interchange protein DsbD